MLLIGNLRGEQYRRIRDFSEFNNVADRLLIVDKLSRMKANDHDALTIIDSNVSSIPANVYWDFINQFRFFIALPGYAVPHTHQFVEMISAGCIPIIQRAMATMICSELEGGVNCIWYDDVSDLGEVFHTVGNLKEKDLITLEEAARDLYRNQFSSSAIGVSIRREIFEVGKIMSFMVEELSVHQSRRCNDIS